MKGEGQARGGQGEDDQGGQEGVQECAEEATG